MTLLEFARGPALYWSTVIFIVGILWRLVGLLLAKRSRDLSVPRGTVSFGGFRTLISRAFPNKELRGKAGLSILNSYVMHIGLFVVIILFVPHILFFKSILGFDWPGINSNIVMVFGAVTLVSLFIALSNRITNPVLYMISSFDDYFSWFVTTFAVLTGMLAFAHFFEPYQTMLAIHILSVELLMIWFPFGKLMHSILIVPSRIQMGSGFGRKGVKV
jgi:nitrate reductase gamma subunit